MCEMDSCHEEKKNFGIKTNELNVTADELFCRWPTFDESGRKNKWDICAYLNCCCHFLSGYLKQINHCFEVSALWSAEHWCNNVKMWENLLVLFHLISHYYCYVIIDIIIVITGTFKGLIISSTHSCAQQLIHDHLCGFREELSYFRVKLTYLMLISAEPWVWSKNRNKQHPIIQCVKKESIHVKNVPTRLLYFLIHQSLFKADKSAGVTACPADKLVSVLHTHFKTSLT